MSEHIQDEEKTAQNFAQRHKNALIISGASFFILTFLTFGVVKATELPEGVITTGVTILNIDVGGLDHKAATAKIQEQLSQFSIPVTANGQTAQLKPFVPDEISYVPVATLNTQSATNEALNIGRRGGMIRNIIGRIRARFFGDAVEQIPSFNDDAVARWINTTFTLGPDAAENAKFAIENGRVIITPEKAGETFLVDDATRRLKRRTLGLNNDVVTVDVEKTTPEVTTALLAVHQETVNDLLKKSALQLTLKENTRTLSAAQYIPLLTVEPNQTGLSINPELAEKEIAPWAAEYLNAPINAEFTEENGRITKFIPHKDGESIDTEGLASEITTAIFSLEGTKQPIAIPLKIVSPEITTDRANPYGIKEIIGIGSSNFAGSPSNRRHNIRTGATALNGIIIPAGQTLSLIQALGNIDAENGYLPELVIKGDRTTPEYGGGLCQIGTTLFRAALNAGLQIPERRNHSYRVSYYERDGEGKYIGPGTDATIYDPSPDLKIKNDTTNNILLLTEIIGNKVTFTMWGVKDGRVAAKSDVKVYNIVSPPEPKITETTDLPPGVKKCSESPHPGADAVFTYTVSYADGRPEFTTDFRSHYRPWGEVCLVGVDPNAVPTTNPDGTPVAPVSTDQPIGTADSSGVSGN